MGLVELLAAMTITSIALLALMASYDSTFMSLHKSAQTSAATTLANTQLELYSALPYTSIGLDSTTFTSTLASDTTYAADETAVKASQTSPTDVKITSCGATAQCLPVQTLTGADRKSYKLETFVHDVVSTGTWTEREVTVIVRDLSSSTKPVVVQMTAGFDKG